MSEPKTLETYAVMPVDVFVGGCGHIVLCQEYSTEKEECYLRVMINPRDAEKVALQILKAARKARGE
jgi:hypothetical protein